MVAPAQRQKEFDVVATAPDGRIALEKILQYRPDVVVLALEMPFLNGIESPANCESSLRVRAL